MNPEPIVRTTHSVVDLAACRANGCPPGDVIPREGVADRWLVAARPIVGPDGNPAAGGPRWTEVATGRHVHVPLIPYRAPRDGALAAAFAAQLGALAVLQTGAYRAVRLHLVVGDAIDDLAPTGADAFGLHLGFALQVEGPPR